MIPRLALLPCANGSPTAPMIFWKQVETGVIEISFHGGVFTGLRQRVEYRRTKKYASTK
jgi:hypothetical protein